MKPASTNWLYALVAVICFVIAIPFGVTGAVFAVKTAARKPADYGVIVFPPPLKKDVKP